MSDIDYNVDFTGGEDYYYNEATDELRRHTATEGVPLILIANKMDIYDEEKHISFEMVEKY